MERRHSVPALGVVRSLDLRRGPLSVLSARIVDLGRPAGNAPALEDGLGRVRLVGPDRVRCCDVSVGAPVARSPQRDLRGPTLRCESLSPGDRLVAQRLGGTASWMPAAAPASLRPTL